MKTNRIRKFHTHETGSVLSEYVVITGMVIAALFVPIPGLGQSAIDFLIISLNAFQSHSIGLLSLP